MLIKMRPKQFSKKKPCYFCGKPATSKEHAPPRLMFNTFDCDSLTVPACEMHNNSKGHKDRAVVSWLLKALSRSIEAGNTTGITDNVTAAIKQIQSNLSQSVREVSAGSFFEDPEIDFEVPYLNFSVTKWLHQLSAAIIWSASAHYDSTIDWEDSYVWSPFYMGAKRYKNVLQTGNKLIQNQFSDWYLRSLNWQKAWSAWPRPYPSDIYSFAICIDPPDAPKWMKLGIYHLFYNKLYWYVWFNASMETQKSIEGMFQDNNHRGKNNDYS
jgi:hypothetical protein